MRTLTFLVKKGEAREKKEIYRKNSRESKWMRKDQRVMQAAIWRKQKQSDIKDNRRTMSSLTILSKRSTDPSNELCLIRSF